MLALKVTPKKQIFLFLILLLSILLTFFKSNFDLKEFELITLLITDKLILNLSAMLTIALVSLETDHRMVPALKNDSLFFI